MIYHIWRNDLNTEKLFVSWSGGKDSCLAAYLAATNGFELHCLLNMVNEDGHRSWTHGLSTSILQMQAEAMGIPLVQCRTSGAAYESKFIETLTDFKSKGVSGGVFGDIDFQIHRDWIENVCNKAGIIPHLPLWGRPQDKILNDFIDARFEAVIVVTKAELMGKEWLGRIIDASFVRDLQELVRTRPITPCGEAGEYHTLVVDGPLFKKRLEVTDTSTIFRDGYWFLDINNAKLITKKSKP